MDGDWNQLLRQSLESYREPLLRKVAQNLCKPRNQWPIAELIERCIATVQNPAVIDRRLKDLSQSSRALLTVIGRSRMARWQVGGLVELTIALGSDDGLQPVTELLRNGLLYPDVSAFEIGDFESWLTQTEPANLRVLAHPDVSQRLIAHRISWPDLPESKSIADAVVQEADGLEWPLRLAVIWQQAAQLSFRRTQNGGYFKRDLQRIQSDALLTGAFPDQQGTIRDIGFLIVAWAIQLGLLQNGDDEVQAGAFTESWNGSSADFATSMWLSLLQVRTWNPENGNEPERTTQPYTSAYLMAMLLIGELPEDGWLSPDDISNWVTAHHPYWKSRTKLTKPMIEFVRYLAYPLGLLQKSKSGRESYVRLSPLGRWLFGCTQKQPAAPAFPQTLMVQPNLEILAYRQGLTPSLIARLGRLASWKQIGGACTLQLEPESVYRALECGETFDSIVQLLEGHGMATVPDAVRESLKTWAKKRDRIRVFPKAAVLEFGSEAELSDAMSRGVPLQRLSERLAVAASESQIDYRHFSLRGSRDYALPPEPCVTIDDDGVTLRIDPLKSDLLLEPEIGRFAQAVHSKDDQLIFHITPSSLASGQAHGVNAESLDQWFFTRTGGPMPPAVRLLLSAGTASKPKLRPRLVMAVADEETADGLQQWPGTRSLIRERLGPTSLAVDETDVDLLRERLRELGVEIE